MKFNISKKKKKWLQFFFYYHPELCSISYLLVEVLRVGAAREHGEDGGEGEGDSEEGHYVGEAVPGRKMSFTDLRSQFLGTTKQGGCRFW